MGITVENKIVYTCDCCNEVVQDYFTQKRVDIRQHYMQGEYFAEYVDVKFDYVKEFSGNQIMCNLCAAEILLQIVRKLKPNYLY